MTKIGKAVDESQKADVIEQMRDDSNGQEIIKMFDKLQDYDENQTNSINGSKSLKTQYDSLSLNLIKEAKT